MTTTYFNGPGIDDHLRQTSATTGLSYFLTDHLGTTAALTDGSGNVVETLAYDSFGNNGGSTRTRYTYTGRERDPDTGLLYYRARFYDPQLGRFISEDPIGFAGGDANLYGYVWQNPLTVRNLCTIPADELFGDIGRASNIALTMAGAAKGTMSGSSGAAESGLAGSIRNLNPTGRGMNGVNCAIAGPVTPQARFQEGQLRSTFLRLLSGAGSSLVNKYDGTIEFYGTSKSVEASIEEYERKFAGRPDL